MTFARLLLKISNWKELVVLDGERVRVIGDFELYGDWFANFVDDYKKTKVTRYKFDGNTLIVHF